MRQIREILRLKWTLQRSHRETARSLGVSAGGVAEVYVRREVSHVVRELSVQEQKPLRSRAVKAT
jgi:hypothetical protein